MKDHITVVDSTAEGGSPQQGDRGSQKAGGGEKAKAQGDTETQAQVPSEPLHPARLPDVSIVIYLVLTLAGVRHPGKTMEGKKRVLARSPRLLSIRLGIYLLVCLFVFEIRSYDLLVVLELTA